jgi:permease of the drug/metabolite transporter
MIAGTNWQWVFYYIFKLLLFVIIGVFTAPFTCLWAVIRVIKAFR